MHLTYFSARGWDTWDLTSKPLIRDRMPVLIDDDLLFEDERGPRPTVVINRWLRELPLNGVPAPKSWEYYARTLRDWTAFLAEHGRHILGDREDLREALSAYAAHRSIGPLDARFAASTWNQSVGILVDFYRWAMAEGHASAEPFTYKQAIATYADVVREVQVNLARRRVPKAHVTVKYLEDDFADMFVKALAGLRPDGTKDESYKGRTLTRNRSVGGAALETGMRRQEYTYLLSCEVPALPPRPTQMPVSFPVPEGVTKGRKFRTTIISYDGLADLHRYLNLVRPLHAARGANWRPPKSWGAPLYVEEFDRTGGRVNGIRVKWDKLTPHERRLLVAPDGTSMLLSLKAGGGPFTAWPTVYARTSDRIRDTFDPRFPHVAPHRLRHSFALRELAKLVRGYYEQVARLVVATDADAALALYLRKADPMMVLRDWLGHSSVLTTEIYLNRLDTQRIFADAYTRSGQDHGLLLPSGVAAEVDDEFDDDPLDDEDL